MSLYSSTLMSQAFHLVPQFLYAQSYQLKIGRPLNGPLPEVLPYNFSRRSASCWLIKRMPSTPMLFSQNILRFSLFLSSASCWVGTTCVGATVSRNSFGIGANLLK